MSIKLVSFKLCPFVQRAVILLEEKAVAYTLEYKELDDPPTNQAIDINTHDGLSLTYH
jgi:glutathione S-transferase